MSVETLGCETPIHFAASTCDSFFASRMEFSATASRTYALSLIGILQPQVGTGAEALRFLRC
jgi:hypothetical protein